MGFFSSLKAMANESHGNAIYIELTDKLRRLRAYPPEVTAASLLAFYYRIHKQEEDLQALPRDIKISTGQYLQSQGRERWDADVVEAVSLYLAGAWIESFARPGHKASEANRILTEILDEHRRQYAT